MDTGVCGGVGGRSPIVVILLNFTMGNLSFSLELCIQKFFLE